jgi:hypothetical protein
MVQEVESRDHTFDGVTEVPCPPVRPPSPQEEKCVDTLPPIDPAKPSVISIPKPELPPVSPGAFDESVIDKEHYVRLKLADTGPREKPFEPCHMFFYGSLMDPEVLQTVLRLPDLPTTTPAIIDGYKIKM